MKKIDPAKKVVKYFVPIFTGLAEYVERGLISWTQLGLYVGIHLQADFSTGLWWGSAPRLLNCGPRGAKLREIQRDLDRLVQIGLLKHFHRQGSRGNFPWIINKYVCRSGALTGMRLNAEKSTSLECLCYEPCADDALTTRSERADDGVRPSHLQEVKNLISKNEEKREKRGAAAKPAAPPDPSAQLYLDKLKRLAGQTVDALVRRMNGEDSWEPTFFGDIRKYHREQADDDGIDFKDTGNVYRGSMRAAEWVVTPLEPVADNPIGPINEQRLQELITEDPNCVGGYMQPDGSAWMEFKDGSMYIPPDGVALVWHPIDDPAAKTENPSQILEMAMRQEPISP
jgi:hypothetical protein